jgi:hypothetical protein
MAGPQEPGLPRKALAEAAGAFAPGFGALLDHVLLGPLRAEWQRNGSKALRAAEAASGLTREAFQERLTADPAMQPLLTRLLFSAGMNGHDPTLAAMGAALGACMREAARLDECALILAALADLNASHTTMLQLLAGEPPLHGEEHRAWTVPTALAGANLPATVAPLVLAALVARGLAQEHTGGYGGSTLRITALGTTVLELLTAYTATG